MSGNSSLIMFYITKFMQDNVYYVEKQDAYVTAEIEEGDLLIYNVFAQKQRNLHNVVEAFGKKIKRVKLGFTPKDKEGDVAVPLKEESHA